MRQARNYIKKGLQRRCFSVKFAKFLKIPILEKHLQTTASGLN